MVEPAPPTDIQVESAIRRTVMAADRTVLAVERTYAAWMRTGLASLAAGVGAHALFAQELPRWLVIFVGVVLVLFAGFCFAAGAWRQMPPKTQDAYPPDATRLPAFFTLGFSLLLAAACVAALVEIVFTVR